MTQPGYIEEAALAWGWRAFAAARMLRRHWREEVEDLPPHLREPLEDYLADLERAGRRWSERQRRRRATAQPTSAQPSPQSEVEVLTTAEAADVIGCTEQNVRKLLANGRLAGEKGSQGWLLDAGAVHAYKQAQREVTACR